LDENRAMELGRTDSQRNFELGVPDRASRQTLNPAGASLCQRYVMLPFGRIPRSAAAGGLTGPCVSRWRGATGQAHPWCRTQNHGITATAHSFIDSQFQLVDPLFRLAPGSPPAQPSSEKPLEVRYEISRIE